MVRFCCSLIIALALVSSAALAQTYEWGAKPVDPVTYDKAGGALAVPDGHYLGYEGEVPAGAQLNADRFWVNANVQKGASFALSNTNGVFGGESGGNAYGPIVYYKNVGNALVTGGYVRVECTPTATGYCIGEKRAFVYNDDRKDKWGQWGKQIVVSGTGGQAFEAVMGDPNNPQGSKSEHGWIVFDDVDVEYCLLCWIQSTASTASVVLVLGSRDEGYVRKLDITRDGDILVYGSSLLKTTADLQNSEKVARSRLDSLESTMGALQNQVASQKAEITSLKSRVETLESSVLLMRQALWWLLPM